MLPYTPLYTPKYLSYQEIGQGSIWYSTPLTTSYAKLQLESKQLLSLIHRSGDTDIDTCQHFFILLQSSKLTGVHMVT